ncbi:hypothetical protein H4R23_006150, partial [Coemansia sp. Cherry 401B]
SQTDLGSPAVSSFDTPNSSAAAPLLFARTTDNLGICLEDDRAAPPAISNSSSWTIENLNLHATSNPGSPSKRPRAMRPGHTPRADSERTDAYVRLEYRRLELEQQRLELEQERWREERADRMRWEQMCRERWQEEREERKAFRDREQHIWRMLLAMRAPQDPAHL